MAVRTTVSKVKDILDETTLSYSQINAYITSANVFVTSLLGSKGLSDNLMAEIERWITAHMIVITRERMAKSAKAGGAEIEYLGKYGEGLGSTPYGQTAISLDTSETLTSNTDGKKTAWSKAVTSFNYN